MRKGEWITIRTHLEQGLADLPSLECSRGVHLIVCWQDAIVTRLLLPPQAIPASVEGIHRKIVRSLEKSVGCHMLEVLKLSGHQGVKNLFEQWSTRPESVLDCLIARPSDTNLSVSVVICTRNRANLLAGCLDALDRLHSRPMEIIVVDNAPDTDFTEKLVQSRMGVRYLLEPTLGLDVARNAGWRQSRGEIVAYVDDDAEVEPTWLDGILRGFSDQAVSAVTGPILPAELETEAQLIFEQNWGFFRGFEPKVYDHAYFRDHQSWGVPTWEIGAGANMAFRREIFCKLGGFDERLDVGAAGCSGDSEYWYRILAAGYTCRYEPSAVALHHHRSSMQALRQQIFSYMRGHTTALWIQYERHRHFGNLKRLFLLIPRYYARLILVCILRFRGLRLGLAVNEVAGVLSGTIFYWQHCRRR